MTGWPEPPFVGSETDTLLGSLERQRATFAFKCADLDAAGLRASVGASSVTLGGLLKHLAYMEDINVTGELAGRELPAPWSDLPAEGRGELVWRSAADDDPETLYRLWGEAVGRSREVLREVLTVGGPDTTYLSSGEPSTVRRLLVDLIEEYGRHTGHADLVREAVDGRVGEDPPGRPFPYALG
ncbi:MAG TPA: DUF664 domain-containing protein [Ornithinibacter sp.]|nr:DUF664 domain-containing protein [Ornithinibacter sp.]